MAWFVVFGGAQALAAEEASTLEEVVVTADKVGLLEKRPTSTVFGLDKPLVETPRSATFVSDLTLERYGIEEVDDLIAISPGAFTASFYGVKGAVNLRGTLAETYFRGFKRIENRGTYPTPLGAASQVDIVRGPPTPVYGPGKVGGLLNIMPKSVSSSGAYIDKVKGQAEVTFGSYSKFNAAGQVGVPLKLGPAEGGVYLYGELEDSKSYYRGISPEHQLVQLSGDFSLPNDITVSFGGMYYNADGYVQTPGWNRLTQALVDNQTYITGRDTSVADLDGNGRITPNEVGGSLVTGYFGFTPTPPPRYTLDTGIGTAKLDRRTVFISNADFSETRTNTLYFDVVKGLDVANSRLKLQVFYDDLKNSRFVSYGFPGFYDSWAFEGRFSYDFTLEAPGAGLKAVSSAGLSYRRQDSVKKESFNSGYIGLDRRDLTVGATVNDIFDSPFTAEPGNIGLQWDDDVHSKATDTGAFLLTDISYLDQFNLLLGARFDNYKVRSRNVGALVFGVRDGEDEASDITYSASISWKTPIGLIPYATYAESSALEVGQAGDLAASLIVGDGDQWLSDSELKEVGVKFDLLGGTLVGSVAGYEQTRTRLSITNSVVATTGRGVEAEVRWVATKNFSFTLSGNRQKTTIEGPDASFGYIPVSATGLAGPQGYGGSFATFNFSTFAGGFPGDYTLRSIPKTVVSLYGSYVTDPFEWGQAGVTIGATSVSETAGKLRNAVVYPSYVLASLSGFVSYGPYTVELNVDNLFDKLYFQPVADVYSDMAVLPGKGREWRMTLKRSF